MDAYGISRTTLRPYLAIDHDPNDSQVLLGMIALNELKVFIDYENGQWQYKLEKSDIQIKSY